MLPKEKMLAPVEYEARLKPNLFTTRAFKFVECYYGARDRFANVPTTGAVSTSLLLRLREVRNAMQLSDVEPHYRIIIAKLAREIRREIRRPDLAQGVERLVEAQ